MTEPSPAGLTPFQIAVADLFFSLPESEGFLLAGGAALAAQHLTTRPTQDLDLFTTAGRNTVLAVRDAFENGPFDRAEARDFADVFVLAKRYRVELMLELAAQIDAGFDPRILATMLGSLARFDDSDIPAPDDTVTELRQFFHQWRQQLLAQPTSDDPA